MRVLIQRVSEASVTIGNNRTATIEKGLLVLVGIGNDDTLEDIEWLANKILRLRVFDDKNNVPNLSVEDIGGDVLLVSQFTLHARVKKGNRPSYINAAPPEIAIPLYEKLVASFESHFGKKIQTGTFGADMKVSLTNDGPFTIWIDSKNRE